MAKRKQYDVTYGKDIERWRLTQEGAKRSTGTFHTKQEAVKRGGRDRKEPEARTSSYP